MPSTNPVVKLEVGETQDVVVYHEPADQPGVKSGFVHKAVTWSSDDGTVATVAPSGLMNTDGHTSSITTITAAGSGKTTVTADTGTQTATIEVDVAPENSDPLVIRLLDSTPSEAVHTG